MVSTETDIGYETTDPGMKSIQVDIGYLAPRAGGTAIVPDGIHVTSISGLTELSTGSTTKDI